MAFIDDVITQMGATIASPRVTETSYLRLANGAGLYNSYGGGASQAKITSFQSIVGSTQGHNQFFAQNYNSNCQFLTINVLDGHTATNTAVDVRRGFSCVLRSDGVWEYSYKDAAMWGKRLYNGDLSTSVGDGTQTQLAGGIVRLQPGAAIALPNESANQKAEAGYEVWPSNWDNSGAVPGMLGNANRALFSQAKCFFLGVQLRLSLWNPSGTDDRSSAIVVAQTGFDAYVVPYTGYRYIYDDGTKTNTPFVAYPYGAFDGSFGPWVRINSNDWMWVYCLAVKDIAAVPAALPPPWDIGWDMAWPWNSVPTYSISEATVRSNPPPDPSGGAVVEPVTEIPDTDPRWVWNIDSRKTFAEVGAKYTVGRQITDFAPQQWPSGVPTDNGIDQIFTQVANPDGSAETVYKMQIRKDRAYGNAHGGFSGYANTWRSEYAGDGGFALKWDVPYWMALAVWLDPDLTAEEPGVVLMDLHVPWQVTSTAVKNSPVAIYGGGGLNITVMYNDHLATSSNDRVVGYNWTDPNPAKNVWHHFVFQLRMGPENVNNYVKAWRKVGSGPVVQIVDYTGRVGYIQTENLKYYYPIQGPYAWTYPWPANGSATRTIYSKGLRIIADSAGTPAIDVTKMMNLIVYGGATQPPTGPVEPETPYTGDRIPLPTLASWFVKDIESKAAWAAKSPGSSGTVIVRRPRRAQIFT